MPSRVLHDDMDLTRWEAFLRAQPFPMTVSHIKGARRSLPQNSTVHKWYAQIAEETGQSQAEAKAECKLRFGLPIMERDKPEWVAKWHALYSPLPYAMRLRLFEAIPVTSEMNVRQMSEYMDAVQREYRTMGIPLIDPEARKYEGEFQ